jgi:predicted Fe-Mo cluster-binding NifX family protein
MKIAVASTGKEISSKIELRFGRARYIIIHDTGKSEFEVIDNQEISELPSGAGVKATEVIVNKNVDYVVSQNFGPKALQIFKAANLNAAVLSEVTVSEALTLTTHGQINII